MKTKFYLLCVILFGFSVCAHAQMKISNSNVLVGGSVCAGGTLNLECSGEVLVVGGMVESGGALNSNCDVQFIGDFEIESGANVELKAY